MTMVHEPDSHSGRGRPALRWIEAHVIAVTLAVCLSVTYALTMKTSPRIPALDWSVGAVPFGLDPFLVVLAASAVIAVPAILIAFLPNMACQWLAVRLGGTPMLHAAFGVPAALVPVVTFFLLGDYTLSTIPPRALCVNALCGAVAGLAFRQVVNRRR